MRSMEGRISVAELQASLAAEKTDESAMTARHENYATIDATTQRMLQEANGNIALRQVIQQPRSVRMPVPVGPALSRTSDYNRMPLFEKHSLSRKIGLITAGLGIAATTFLGLETKGFQHWDNLPGMSLIDQHHDQDVEQEYNTRFDPAKYPDTTTQPGKGGIHDFGPQLANGTEKDVPTWKQQILDMTRGNSKIEALWLSLAGYDKAPQQPTNPDAKAQADYETALKAYGESLVQPQNKQARIDADKWFSGMLSNPNTKVEIKDYSKDDDKTEIYKSWFYDGDVHKDDHVVGDQSQVAVFTFVNGRVVADRVNCHHQPGFEEIANIAPAPVVTAVPARTTSWVVQPQQQRVVVPQQQRVQAAPAPEAAPAPQGQPAPQGGIVLPGLPALNIPSFNLPTINIPLPSVPEVSVPPVQQPPQQPSLQPKNPQESPRENPAVPPIVKNLPGEVFPNSAPKPEPVVPHTYTPPAQNQPSHQQAPGANPPAPNRSVPQGHGATTPGGQNGRVV
jgi:hypothetical protein